MHFRKKYAMITTLERRDKSMNYSERGRAANGSAGRSKTSYGTGRAERDTAQLPTVQAEVLLLMARVPEEAHPVPSERDRQRRHRQERPERQSARRSIQSFACFLRYFFC